MSRETQEWLSNYTLIGLTDKRGQAWHWRKGDDNHFPGPIPVEVIRERLFFWEPDTGTVESNVVTNDGVYQVTAPGRKKIIRPATPQLGPAAILGEFNLDTPMHSYDEWLIGNVETILHDGLVVGSAGLLKSGAQAWVQVELPDTVKTPEGVEFSPYLTAATSLDGSLATTYKRGNNVVVCDNTLHAALKSDTMRIRVKHTKNSATQTRIQGVRDALNIVHTEAEDFAREIRELCATEVSNRQWRAFLDAYTPLPEQKLTKGGGPGSGYTRTENKRDKLTAMYLQDYRVTDWTGTAFGVLQAVNTYNMHETSVRGDLHRVERNMINDIKDKIRDEDVRVLDTLNRVLVSS